MAFSEKTILNAIPMSKQDAVASVYHEPESGVWFVELRDGWYDFEPSGAVDWRTVTDLNRCSTMFTVPDALTVREARRTVATEFHDIHQSDRKGQES